jgi:hypothetical protein
VAAAILAASDAASSREFGRNRRQDAAFIPPWRDWKPASTFSDSL